MEPYIYTQGGNVHLTPPKLFEPGNIPPIEYLAQALANINRFTGHTVRPYSVAEHSLLTSLVCSEHACCVLASPLERYEMLLACLTHDLHEALVGDVTTPIKHVLGEAWYGFEDQVESAVREALGLTLIHEKYQTIVKHCDLIALATEKRDLLRCSEPWAILENNVVIPWREEISVLDVTTPSEWADLLVRGFEGLRAKIKEEQQKGEQA